MPRPKLLIVDDERHFTQSLARVLRDEFQVVMAFTADEGRALFLQGCDVVLLDMRLNESDPRNREGLDLLREFHSLRSDIPVVMITAYGDIETAVEAMKCGATDFLPKPFEMAKLRTTIVNAIRRSELERKVASLQRDILLREPPKLIGQDPKMDEVRQLVEAVAQDGRASVLLVGETGTGKELVARLIHQRGYRAEGPFVGVSIADLPGSLVERELFGHEKGAFTDAYETRPGYFEQANKGVLFLDEIDSVPLDVQVKLLRFLEEREFRRVGGSIPIRVDVQIVAATKRDLRQLINEGRFRDDLYFRLRTFEIRLPPLRERRGDVPLLVNHFLKLFKKQGRTVVSQISPEALRLLEGYNWPGNVRELKSMLEGAVIRAEANGHTRIEADDLPMEMRMQPIPSDRTSSVFPKNSLNIDEAKARFELQCIEQALMQTGARKTDAARVLGLNDRFALRRRLRNLFRRYPHLFEEFPLARQAVEKGKGVG